MDRSMDSIGSCSLDVDAESTDISDTSGSLNFPTPISIKDITREFTNNIRERCSVQTVKNTTAFVNPATGQVCIALTQPAPTAQLTSVINTSKNHLPVILSPQTPELCFEKKPSYLNLACCVNGYSNITTYDSKIRQDINKSREVSPIRPSSSALQYCRKSNSLAPPVLLTMPNISATSPTAEANKHFTTLTTTNSNGDSSVSSYIGSKNVSKQVENDGSGAGAKHLDSSVHDLPKECHKLSFIQQRVERLYGPGALAQGFYSPRKSKDVKHQQNGDSAAAPPTTELLRKFQELSPSKDYNQFRKKLNAQEKSPNGTTPTTAMQTNDLKSLRQQQINENDNKDVDLPCLRHLSQEFRAQLPSISPKRHFLRTSPMQEPPRTLPKEQQQQQQILKVSPKANGDGPYKANIDEVDHRNVVTLSLTDHELKTSLEVISPKHLAKDLNNSTSNGYDGADATLSKVKDAHYFLEQLKVEQQRLLQLADKGESYITMLTNNPNISEDVFGLLRSASGKARLLVSQKMKQFEGLCHNNLNRKADDKFPTTLDDLQGFWDMVHLQVDHVDSIFEEIEQLKDNEWTKSNDLESNINDNNATATIKSPRIMKTRLSNKRFNANLTNGNSSAMSTATIAATTTTPTAAAIKRELHRKKLQELKRRNREAMASTIGDNNGTALRVEVVESPKKLSNSNAQATAAFTS